MLNNIIGSIFFEFLGALIRWIFYAMFNRLSDKKIISFKEMWSGRKGSQKADIVFNGTLNIMIGLIFTIGLILLGIYIERFN